MSLRIEAREVDELATAVRGLDIEYVRTDVGIGPCRVDSFGRDDVHLSSATMGFSTLAHTSIPDHLAVFVLIDVAPAGATFCGIELTAGQLHFYAPGTPFVGVEPAGLRTTVFVVPTLTIERAAEHLGIAPPAMSASVEPLAATVEVGAFARLLVDASNPDRAMRSSFDADGLIAAATTALRSQPKPQSPDRRLDSRTIVLDCIAFVEENASYRPSMKELCRAAQASESRVRQAFVEVLGAPPTQFFRYSLLGRLRGRLLHADADLESVTDVASSLGVTQLGRTAGRYRSVFDELPSQTLRR